jgi:hypothetical protein
LPNFDEGLESILPHLRRLIQDESEAKIFLDRKFIESIMKACEVQMVKLVELKAKFDGIKVRLSLVPCARANYTPV